MLVKPSEWYSEDYFYPKSREYVDEWGVTRTYFGPSKDWSGFDLIALFIKNNFNIGTISDIGCSAGGFVARSVNAGFDTIGVDISRFAINNCVDGARGKLRVVDITKDSPIRQSDMAVAFDLMEHIYQKDIDKALDYISNSIKPGGYFFACIATARNENETWQHTSENDLIPQNRNWLAVSGHVNIKWLEDWIQIFKSIGFIPDYEKMYRFQLWRTHNNELSQCDSWGLRNIFIGKKQ